MNKIQEELSRTVEKAPQFFKMAPLVLDISAITPSHIDFTAIQEMLKKLNLFLVGVRGLCETLTSLAKEAGLHCFPNVQSPSPSTQAPEPKAEKNTPSTTMILDQPVRSGQQIYAKEGDLIIIGSVSPGAELLAAGSIHVYGALRGRALAGIHGNQNARIFCNLLEAELLSIAGIYQLSEDFLAFQNETCLQIYLKEERLFLESYK